MTKLLRGGILRRLAMPIAAACVGLGLAASVQAADPVTLTVNVDQPGAKIDPIFYGLMTEEINYCYDGGLYAELIRNRVFQGSLGPQTGGRGNRGGRGATNPASAPATPPPAPAAADLLSHWSLVTSDGATGTMAIDTTDPVNTIALKNSLRLDITAGGAGKRVGVANEGYWGIPVKPNWEYKASFYAKATPTFSGPLTVAIEGNNGTVYATATVPTLTAAWKKYEVTLKTAQTPTTAEAKFVISGSSPGSVWLSLVSLFPPTYKNRPNGNRIDLMELLAGMKPAFLRFPGGNYLEGPNFENRFYWKQMIGTLEERPTHITPWGRQRSSDGMGLMEFLMWCEELNMEPIVGVYAGLHIDGGRGTITGDALKPHVQDALDEIEYIIGDVNTTWGARRAKDGHPAPFKLRYVEVGNEDWLNGGLQNYNLRFPPFYDAIKAKYPQLKIISSMQSRNRYDHGGRTPDLLDDHDYMNIPTALSNVHRYDTYPRDAVKIFAGEWATNNPGGNPRGGPTGHMAFALADAAWLTGLERNADVVIMNCYAPLFCNINQGAMHWAVNLIGYDAVGSFGSPAYYVQKMYANNRGDVVLPAKFEGLPMLTREQIPIAPRPSTQPTPIGNAGPYDGLYCNATREDSTGDVILKLVNIQATAQPMKIDLKGAANINSQAKGEILTAALDAMNSVAEPTKVSPKPITITNAAASFTHELPGHSVTVLRLKTK